MSGLRIANCPIIHTRDHSWKFPWLWSSGNSSSTRHRPLSWSSKIATHASLSSSSLSGSSPILAAGRWKDRLQVCRSQLPTQRIERSSQFRNGTIRKVLPESQHCCREEKRDGFPKGNLGCRFNKAKFWTISRTMVPFPPSRPPAVHNRLKEHAVRVAAVLLGLLGSAGIEALWRYSNTPGKEKQNGAAWKTGTTGAPLPASDAVAFIDGLGKSGYRNVAFTLFTRFAADESPVLSRPPPPFDPAPRSSNDARRI